MMVRKEDLPKDSDGHANSSDWATDALAGDAVTNLSNFQDGLPVGLIASERTQAFQEM
jgi:hypothetical protein